MARKRINPKAKVDLARIFEVIEKKKNKTADNHSPSTSDHDCDLLCDKCNYNCDLKDLAEDIPETTFSESDPFDYERAVLNGWKPDDPW